METAGIPLSTALKYCQGDSKAGESVLPHGRISRNAEENSGRFVAGQSGIVRNHVEVN